CRRQENLHRYRVGRLRKRHVTESFRGKLSTDVVVIHLLIQGGDVLRSRGLIFGPGHDELAPVFPVGDRHAPHLSSPLSWLLRLMWTNLATACCTSSLCRTRSEVELILLVEFRAARWRDKAAQAPPNV